MRSIMLVLLVACSKPAPSADCDAFAKQFATKLATPTDGELTKQAIALEAATYRKMCRDDKWSVALADCVAKSPTDATKTCPFTADQAQHLKDTTQKQADDMRKSLENALSH